MTTPRRALILVDVQQEYFAGPLEIRFPPHAFSLPRIAAVIDAATAAGLPIAAFQHSAGEGAPVFAPGTEGFELHPEIERRRTDDWTSITKQYGTVFAGTDLAEWLRSREIDTVTLVGYMTNNCVLASAVEAGFLGVTVEVLSAVLRIVSKTSSMMRLRPTKLSNPRSRCNSRRRAWFSSCRRFRSSALATVSLISSSLKGLVT